jgi:hypothetical protein
VLLGSAFAAYGIALIVVGSARGTRLDRAVEEGRFAPLSQSAERLLAAVGALLGIAVIAVIAIS